MTDVLMVGFGVFTIACGVGVVVARQPVYSAFSLILCFFGLAGIYLLREAHFVAVIQILIYAGAIVVIFVFVVMLLNISKTSMPGKSWATIFIACITGWLFSFVLLRILNRSSLFRTLEDPSPNLALRSVAKLLFNEYLWPFEVLSLFLLVLIIAVYALTQSHQRITERVTK